MLPVKLEIVSTSFFVWNTVSPGYGFTIPVELSAADASGCPLPTPLESRVWVPHDGWNQIDWSADWSGFDRFVVTMRFEGTRNGTALLGDHRPENPPEPCGVCYPIGRPIHSFRFESATEVFCPGKPIIAGTCPAEFAQETVVREVDVISVEARSWSGIKAMYR